MQTLSAPDPTAFVAAMLKLPDTGNAGFEGFVRDCLEELLGQSFRLMKSGHQHGMDGANDAPANGLAIGFEGKKYGSNSNVSVAEVQRMSTAEQKSAMGRRKTRPSCYMPGGVA